MHGVGPEDVGPQRKKPNVINDGALNPSVGRGVAGTSNHISRAVFPAQSVEQPPELLVVGRVDPVVGVEPEGVIAGGVLQGFIAGRREIVDPGEFKDGGSVSQGDLASGVRGAGVHDDDFVKQSPDRFQTEWKVILFVTYDHHKADASLAGQTGLGLAPTSQRDGQPQTLRRNFSIWTRRGPGFLSAGGRCRRQIQ